MKTTGSILLLIGILFVAVPCGSGVNQWTTGPLGGSVIHLAIDPTTPERVFVAVSSGVFRSADSGDDWQLVYPTIYPRWIAFDPTTDPSTVYVAARDGLFQSDDAGDTWSEISEGLPGFGQPDESPILIEVAPSDPAVIYLGTESDVYRITRGTSTWETLILPFGHAKTIAIDPVDPDHVVLGMWAAGVLVSHDAGSSWTNASAGLPNLWVHSLSVDTQSSATMYVALAGAGMWKTIDAGETWSGIGGEIDDPRHVIVDPVDPTIVLVGSQGGGVYRSTDAGATWAAINEGLSYMSIQTLAVDPVTNLTLYAGTSGGMFRSDNGGDNWAEKNQSLVATSGNDLALDPTSIHQGFSTAFVATGDVFNSIDGGASWDWVADGLEDTTVDSLAIDYSDSDTIYAGTWGDGVFKTTDAGGSWFPVNGGIVNGYGFADDIVIDPIDPDTLYCTGRWTVYKTIDGGGSWLPVNTGLPAYFTSKCLEIDPNAPSTVFVGTGHTIFKTLNGGENWTPANTGLPDTSIPALVVDPSDSQIVYAATSFDTSHVANNGVYRSLDGGATWSGANDGLGNLNVRSLTVDPVRPLTLYAGTFDGIYQSIDGATTWTPMSAGLPEDTIVGALTVDPMQPERLYAGASGRGVFMIDLDPCTEGVAWIDQNEDGIRGESEPPMVGMEVHLLDADGSVIDSTTTDGRGFYSFPGLPWDNYIVEFTPPESWSFTVSTADPDDPSDSDVDPSTGRTAPVYVYAGRIYLSLGAGLIESPMFADGFESGDISRWSR